MGKKKHAATAFTLVVEPGAVRVRKPYAPVARPMADKRRKDALRKADLLLEAGQAGQ